MAKTTHVRIDKDLLKEFKTTYPNMTTNEVVKMSWNTYKGLQNAGRFLYGRIWKDNKK